MSELNSGSGLLLLLFFFLETLPMYSDHLLLWFFGMNWFGVVLYSLHFFSFDKAD